MARRFHYALPALPERLLWAVLCLGIVGAAGPALAQPTPVEQVVTPPPPVPCIENASAPRHEVEAAFAELQRIHRSRIAGPAGQQLIESRVNALLERLVGFDLFIDLVLGDAWEIALPEQRLSWRTALADTLRRRYLNKLGSPLAASVDIQGVVMHCDRAVVSIHISDRKGKHPQDVLLHLVATRVVPAPTPPEDVLNPPPADPPRPVIEWRAFDVAVDGVSLLETWKSRFRRIYEDGGVAAIDYHMRGLADRYGPHSD